MKPKLPKVHFEKEQIFWGVLVAIVLVSFELLSMVFLMIQQGEVFGRRVVWEAQRAVIESGGVTKNPDSISDNGVVRGEEPGRIIHPYVGFVLRGSEPEKIFKLPINESKESLLKHDPNRIAVGIMGGSVAAGQTRATMDSKDLQNILSQYPRFKGKKVQVIQLAAGGLKQPQQLMMLSYILGLGGHLDILINLDGFNEFFGSRMMTAMETYPYFPISWPNQAALSMDLERNDFTFKIMKHRKKRVLFAKVFNSPTFKFSSLLQVFWQTVDLHWQEELNAQQTHLAKMKTKLEDGWAASLVRGQWDKKYNDTELLFTEIGDLWARTSIAMNALAEGHGIEYYHFVQPSQYLPGMKPMGEEEEKIALSKAKNFAEHIPLMYDIIENHTPELKAAGVKLYDLRDIFIDEPKATYRDGCCHLNQYGQSIVNTYMGEVIVKDLRGW